MGQSSILLVLLGLGAVPEPAKDPLPPGCVRGDVVSRSYVPIKTWRPQESIGILPYLFEYSLMRLRRNPCLCRRNRAFASARNGLA
ncbi:MAG: hypothetical protein JXP34_03190 [Planctomycetes bacterium]|nr:hypothetical protein [Planctomycetota bacterium]